MLTPDQIEALRIQSGQIISPVIEFLIADIASRIAEAGQLTSTAAYQIWRAQNLGISQKKLQKELQKRLKVSKSQLQTLLKQAAEVGYDFDISRFPTVEAIPFDENESLQRIVETAANMTQESFENLTQTMGFVTHDGKVTGLAEAYRKSCDFAFEKVFTGAQDYNSAIREATKGLAEKGIQTIDYDSGVHTSLEAAVRRNIMGGLGLMQEQITQQNHDDLGCDGWEISAHRGSAPDHEDIQGKQFTDKEFRELNNSPKRRPIGTLNCGHSAMGIIMGINDPQYTPEELAEMKRENAEGITYEDGKHYTLYEATQRQRGLERTLRKQKRKILIDEKTGDKEKLAIDQTRYVVANDEYHRFSKAAGLRLQHERANVPGFGAKQHSAAEAVAKTGVNKPELSTKNKNSSIIHNKTLAKSVGSGTIISGLTDTDVKAIHDYMSSKSYVLNEKLRTGAPLSDEDRAFVANLDAALKKMPTCKGELQRSLYFDTADDLHTFLQKHISGAKVTYKEYISTTKGEIYNPDGQVQMHILNARTGRDISSVNAKEAEVLYERNSTFVITNVFEQDGKYYIYAEESNE